MQNNPQLNNIQLDENGQVIPTLQGKVSQNWYNRLVNPIINVANKYQNWADTNRSNIENLPRDNQLNNLGLGLSNIGQQYIDMTAHPIQTIQGAGYALTHLPETTNAIYDKLVNGTVDYFSNPQAMYENPAYPLEQINDVAGIALAGKGLGQVGKSVSKFGANIDKMSADNARMLYELNRRTGVDPNYINQLENELTPQALEYYNQLRGNQ